jgi:hypothetical protein
MYETERMHQSAKDLSLRNRLYKNSTADNEYNTSSHRIVQRLKGSYDEDDTDDAPVIIQRVKAFNTSKQSKHFVPVTRISLQDQCPTRKRADSSEIKMFHTLSTKSKDKKDYKLDDLTNDSYLNKVKSRFSKKILPLTENCKENQRERKAANKFADAARKCTQKKGRDNKCANSGASIQSKSIRTPISLKLNVNSPPSYNYNYQTVSSQLRSDTEKSKKARPGDGHSKLKMFLKDKIKSKGR